MHFTIVFDAHEGYDLTAGLVFKPAPVWVSGGVDLLVPHPEDPAYRMGDLRLLLGHTAMQREFPMESQRVVVVVHESGYGTERDLDTLVADLEAEGFAVSTAACGPAL